MMTTTMTRGMEKVVMSMMTERVAMAVVVGMGWWQSQDVINISLTHPLSPPCSSRSRYLPFTHPYTSLFETNPSRPSLHTPPPPVISFTSPPPSAHVTLSRVFFFFALFKKKKFLLLPPLTPTPLSSRTAVSHDKFFPPPSTLTLYLLLPPPHTHTRKITSKKKF